jgi:hypothetical protein
MSHIGQYRSNSSPVSGNTNVRCRHVREDEVQRGPQTDDLLRGGFLSVGGPEVVEFGHVGGEVELGVGVLEEGFRSAMVAGVETNRFAEEFQDCGGRRSGE